MITRVAYLISPGLEFMEHSLTHWHCSSCKPSGTKSLEAFFIFQSDIINRYLISYLFVILPQHNTFIDLEPAILVLSRFKKVRSSGNCNSHASLHRPCILLLSLLLWSCFVIPRRFGPQPKPLPSRGLPRSGSRSSTRQQHFFACMNIDCRSFNHITVLVKCCFLIT